MKIEEDFKDAEKSMKASNGRWEIFADKVD